MRSLGVNKSSAGVAGQVILAANANAKYRIKAIWVGVSEIASGAVDITISSTGMNTIRLPLTSPGPAPLTFGDEGLVTEQKNAAVTVTVATPGGSSVAYVNVLGELDYS